MNQQMKLVFITGLLWQTAVIVAADMQITVPARAAGPAAFRTGDNLAGGKRKPWWEPSDGFCSSRGNISMWPKFPDSVCTKIACMYSPVLQHGVKILDIPRVDMADMSKWDQVNGFANCYANTFETVSTDEKIAVSLIFTVHNSPEMAVRCILDIFSTILEIPDATEMVVVDDASDADMSAVHGLLRTLRVLFGYRVNLIVSERNLGYGASNNIALKAAKGEYALLLNSDILVNPGWLAALFYTIRVYPKAGMVGPMMVGVDGIVKESGSLIYRGGQPANFGRQLKPDKVPYLHARAVDYISAACLLVRRQLFLDLGLFDPQFEPAYYEDTDAAMVHLRAGWLTVLQPLAVVTHAEGASISSKAKEDLMARNKQRFYEKHRAVLDNFCPAVHPSCKLVQYCAGETYAAFVRDGPHVLVMDKHLPRPDRDAASVRLVEVMKTFALLGYKVSLEVASMPAAEDAYRVSLLADGVYVQPVGMLQSLVRKRLNAATSMGIHCPWDIIYISKRAPGADVVDQVKALCPHARLLYDTGGLQLAHEAGSAGGVARKEAARFKFMQKADAVLVMSEEDRQTLLQADSMLPVHVLSSIYPPPMREDPTALNTRRGALFVGNVCHAPNRNALDFIFNSLGPLIMGADATTLKITLVLSDMDKCNYPDLQELAKSHKIEVLSHLSDYELMLLHRRVRMVIAPMRFGVGVKGKVNYALLQGTPVVISPVAAHGMHVTHGESALISDVGVEFLMSMRKLASDDNLWRRLQKSGWNVMEKYFTHSVAIGTFREVISTKLKLQLPAWGYGVDSPTINLRACPSGGSTADLPRGQCGDCWHCPLNEHFYFPPVVSDDRKWC